MSEVARPICRIEPVAFNTGRCRDTRPAGPVIPVGIFLISACVHTHAMNGTNKTTVGVVFGIALAYAALSLVLTIMEILDGGPVSIYLFAPHGGELGIDLSQVAGIDRIVELYAGFVALFGDDRMMSLVIVLLGFVMSAVGMMTPWSMSVKSDTNPAEYLWVKRPGSVVRGLGAPWGLIGTCWNKSKPLAIVPIVLLPFYAVWSVMITVFMLLPFLVMKAVIGSKVRSAARREQNSGAGSAVCPKCKRNFSSPKVRCKCGLILDYPVPNEYGYKVHTCENGHDIPCTHGMRRELVTVCPFCEQEIETREAVPISIALVGAQGAGKTTLMLAAVGTISQVARTRDVAVDAATSGVDRNAVAAKDVVARTASGELDSECLFLRSRDMSDRELIFNDISGTEFEPKEGKTLFQEYYRYSDGIVFAFDPIALENGRGSSPMDVFESFHSTFNQINGVGPGAVSRIPFAVVATHNDVLSPSLASSDVKKFLMDNGQGGFVRVLESVFSDVRYFAATSTGDDCKSAAVPFWWIVGKTDQELASKVPVLSV